MSDQENGLEAARRAWHRQRGEQGLSCPTNAMCEAFNAGYRAAHASTTREPPSAAADVLAERRRQVEEEGYNAEHDAEHTDGSLALAAACYASVAANWAQHGKPSLDYASTASSFRWPWSQKWWKPKDPRRDLVRAGALIVAEIERLDRQSKPKEQK